MKKTLLVLVIGLGFTAFSAAAQRVQSVLWQVSGKGLAQPSYLFGTVHTLPPSVLNKFPVQQYLKRAQFGIFEVVGSPLLAAPPKASSASPRPQPPLDSLFSPPDYAVVDSFFAASPYGSIKPHNNDADLLSMLGATMMLRHNPDTAHTGLDGGIAEELKRLGKPAFRLDADDDPDINKVTTSYTRLAETIVAIIRDKGDLRYYVPGDTKGTYVQHLAANMQLHEEATGLLKDLTVRRNLRWMPQLEQKMREGSCFVAVGLGHLKFKDGLIELLRRNGYTLKPVALAKSK
jgi:hypothetical protein